MINDISRVVTHVLLLFEQYQINLIPNVEVIRNMKTGEISLTPSMVHGFLCDQNILEYFEITIRRIQLRSDATKTTLPV